MSASLCPRLAGRREPSKHPATVRIKPNWRSPLLGRLLPAPLLALASVTGHAADRLQTGDRRDKGVSEEPTTAGLERWRWRRDIRDCRFRRCRVTLTADVRNGSGTVEALGSVAQTTFRIRESIRRWDWCTLDEGTSGCTFLMGGTRQAIHIEFRFEPRHSDGVRRVGLRQHHKLEYYTCRKLS